jgi:hypothetical protein
MFLMYPQKKKPRTFKSGFLGGQGISPLPPIHWFGNFSSNAAFTRSLQWGGAPGVWKNCFEWRNPVLPLSLFYVARIPYYWCSNSYHSFIEILYIKFKIPTFVWIHWENHKERLMSYSKPIRDVMHWEVQRQLLKRSETLEVTFCWMTLSIALTV